MVFVKEINRKLMKQDCPSEEAVSLTQAAHIGLSPFAEGPVRSVM